ncbi:MAG: uracil-DNA glycosylase family protein [Candidatus Dormibacter sp.]|uniref:uracil-DNA glycosylase family protein n=1 Tax=Candidatus Dormibacter sp. TaxID=2973982 RepID=UPI000DB08737|nr:MAG: uracil-DNA glycosylase [Candidatus Dormibacteraeota bacterium]
MTDELSDLQAACSTCRICADQGLVAEAKPIFEGRRDAEFFLIGQAPGPVEHGLHRPFMGRAGRELERWMLRARFSSGEEFRRHTYIAAIMRCFPGPNASGSGDRPPPAAAIRNCSHWLEAELKLVRPRAVLLVGQLAAGRFLGPAPLDERVGQAFGSNPVLLPLPHPSGTSRWLNDPANRERLTRALDTLSRLRERCIGG